MKYNKSLLALALALSLPTAALASSSWVLSKDQNLNGVVENASDQTLENKVILNKFSASSDVSDSDFMGELIEDSSAKVIKFQETADTEVINYLGIAVDGGYQGTWYSTSGDTGDFGFSTTISSGGGLLGQVLALIPYHRPAPQFRVMIIRLQRVLLLVGKMFMYRKRSQAVNGIGKSNACRVTIG